MNNNNLGRVAVRTSSRKRNSTPLNFDVNATASVGSVLPFMVREIVPNARVSVNTRNLVRLATMVVPTYGRLRLNLRHYFVGMSDLTKNFEALLSEQVISRAHASFRPTLMPYISKAFASLMCLVGSHVSLYRVFNSSNDTTTACEDRLYKVITDDLLLLGGVTQFWCDPAYQNIAPTDWDSLNNGSFYKKTMPVAWQDAWNGYTGPALNISKLAYAGEPTVWGGSGKPQAEFWIPIENKDWSTFFKCDPTLGPIPSYANTSVVGLGKGQSDAVISIRPRSNAINNAVGHLACRFSSFGQRWFNACISSGFGIDYGDFAAPRSVMPIFAYYKAYWESFGLELYRKWENSPVVKMMCAFDDLDERNFEYNAVRTGRFANGEVIDNGVIPPQFYTYWCNFVCDVGNMYYTEEQDFTSAHTREATISPANMDQPMNRNPLPNSPTTVSHVDTAGVGDSATSVVSANARTPLVPAGSPFSQLDIETLKRLYKVVNRNTIAGQNIAKLLELQGLGDYVNSCKSRFIGEFNVNIDIDEVTATSDAFDSEGSARSLLGEQGAKGVGFGASKKFKVSNNEFGYYIILASVVPEAGYVNCALAGALDISKGNFYNPEYDGLGMELNAKELAVTAQQDWSDSTSSEKLSKSAFGFVPLYSRHKVQPNFALGGFALRSEREYYRSFFMDKIIDVGERFVHDISVSDDPYDSFSVTKLFPVDRTPSASPNWRFVGRYPWIENYLRIFAATGDPLRNNPVVWNTIQDFVSNYFDFTFRDEDKFILQNRIEFMCSAPWLKITDSYETKEDGNVGSTDLSIGKE